MNALKAAVRYGYFPLVLLGMNGAALYLVSVQAPPASLFWLLALAVSVSFGLERFVPYNPSWNDSQGDRSRDFAHALVNESSQFLNLLLLPILASHLAVADLWPEGLPFAVQVIFAVVVLDLGITLAHLASHRNQFLWRFHAVHHSVRRMYGFNGLI